MEIYGKLGKLDLNGLGGSYGLEKLTFYKMLPQMGPPKKQTWKFPLKDLTIFPVISYIFKSLTILFNLKLVFVGFGERPRLPVV